MTTGVDRNEEKITEMVVFSHGVVGKLALCYHGFNWGSSLNISISDLKKWGDISSAFSEDYFCVLYACNTGTEKNGTSFAQTWADATGGYVIGIAGLPDGKSPNNAKTDYSGIDSGRRYERFSPRWKEFWFGSKFYMDGSFYYPQMSQEHPGQWNIYTPNASPIKADSIMNIDERLTKLPTLEDIKSLK